MPPLPVVPNVVRTLLQSSEGADTNILNRMFWVFSGTVTEAIATAIAEQVATAWTSNLLDKMNTGVTLDTVECQDLSSDTGAFGSHASGETGGMSGDALPTEVTAIINLFLARHYRGGHPRLSISGFNWEQASDPTSWTSTFVTDLIDGYQAFQTAMLGYSTGGVTITAQVNVSYYNGFTPVKYPSGRYRNVPNVRTEPLIDYITGFTVNPKVGSQRRRSQHSR